MNLEEQYIFNIKNGIRAIKLGSKTPKDSNVGYNLNRLKGINEGMYDDLLAEYIKIKKDYDLKNKV